MHAAVLHAPRDLRIEEVPDPVAGPGDVLIEVSFNGLCGTDLTEYTKGPLMVPLDTRHPGSGHLGPTILGHEFVGTVVGAGRDAQAWIGKRVATGAGVSCGTCRWCRAGRTNLCARYYTLGLSIHGGLAGRAAVPASTLLELPQACPDHEAVLAQPLAVGLHAVSRAGITPGDTVIVLGAGAIGSFIIAALGGYEGTVVAVDIDQARLDCAKALGATETVLIEPGLEPAALRSMLPDDVHVVIESSGVPGGAQRACELVARGGTVLLVGLVKAAQPLDMADLVLREVTVQTTVAHVCAVDLPAALGLLSQRPLSALLVDRTVALADVVTHGLEPLAAGAVSGKVIVDVRNG